MSSRATSNAYVQVIEDVINNVRQEFVGNDGPGETALKQLQGLWEAKMMKTGSIIGPIQRPSSLRPNPGGSIAPFHDLNVPYETEEYETPTTDLLFPPTPMHTLLPGSGQAPLPGTVDSSPFNISTGGNPPFNISTGGNPFTPGEYTTDNGGGSEARSGIPSQFMQPPAPWLTQTQRPPLDVNVAYDENHEAVNMGASHQPTTQDFLMISSGKRKREDFPSQYHNGYIPQQDGAGDTVSDELKAGEGSPSADPKSAKGLSSWAPQVDGPVPDQYDDALSTPVIFNYQEVVIEDYNIVTPARDDLQAGSSAIVTQDDVAHGKGDEHLNPVTVTQNDVAHDEDDELLNDDDDLDDVDQEEDTKKEHLILAQFDKVSRTKNRWKCSLKNGIMHMDNSETLFNKANGEFEF